MQHNPGFLKLVDAIRPQIKEIEAERVVELLKGQKDFAFIDCREESEWAKGQLPKAVHLSKGILERDVESRYPDKSTEIVLYCGGGFRSVLAAYNLQEMGYTRVFSMKGGYREWLDHKLPMKID